MKKIIRLAGVNVANDALPRVEATPGEMLLASIPELIFWLQAGARHQVDATTYRDRSRGATLSTVAASQYRYAQGAFASGAPALVGVDGATANYVPSLGTDLRPDRWTVATVVQVPDTLASDNNGLLGMQVSHTTGAIGMRIDFRHVQGIRLLGESAADSRVFYVGSQWKAGPALIVFTFSQENGLTLRVNGAEVARNASDRRVLTDTRWKLGQSGTAAFHNFAFSGRIGHLMMFNTDLAALQNRGYLAGLESVLKSFYGIA